MVLIQNEQADSVKWTDLLLKATDYSPFQTEEFHRLFNSSDDLHSDVFAVEDNSEYVCLAVVTIQKENGLLSIFSSRGIIYGGIVARDNRNDAIGFLLDKMEDYYRDRLIYIEVRNSFNSSQYLPVFNNNGWKYQPWLNIQKDIYPEGDLLKGLSSSKRRQVRNAFNNGALVAEATTAGEIEDFYTILSELYRNRIKKPLLPYSFFLKAFESGFADFILVKYESKIIGGIMLIPLEGKALYEFYICGLDDRFPKQYPSVVSTWAGLDYARRNNIPLFDFMGAGIPDREYGVREFKQRFGGRLVEHGRYIKISSPLLYHFGKTGLKLVHLPHLIKKYAS